MQPLVSAIIPVYNSEKWIDKAIASIQNQTYKNIEIIVVDDGSTDNTNVILKQYEHKSNISIHYIENSGPAKARNYGVTKARGEYIAFLDSDDEWDRNKIKKQINYMLKHKCELLLTNLKLIDESNNILGKQDKTLPKNKEKQVIDLFLNKITQNTPTIMVKKEIFDEFGGFNEKLVHREDHFFLMQVANKYGLNLLEDYLVYRRIWSHSMSSDYNIFKDKPLNIVKYYEKTRKPFLKESIITFPYLKKFYNHGLSNYYYHLSHILFRLCYYRDSRIILRKSLKYKFKFKYFIKLLLLYLPTALIDDIVKNYYK